MPTSNQYGLYIDALQVPNPSRDRFIEWRNGGLDCVHVTVAIWENARETLSEIGTWHRLFDDNADLIALATNAQDIKRIAASGRTAVILGFQDTSPFEDDLELFEVFYKLGIRIAQLTYNVQNRIASGCWENDDLGISGFFGKNVIAEMNRLGMMIDVSHCNARTTLDAIEMSARPIAITHANPSDFVGDQIELKRRNKSLDAIKKLAESKGVIGLSLYPKIMRDGSDCTIETFVDMISWTVERIGVDAVGIGTDFYSHWPESEIMWWRAGRFSRTSAVPIKGFSRWPTWFQTPADSQSIIVGMEKRGFNGEEIGKIIGGNWLRLFGEGFQPAVKSETAAA